MIKRVLAAFFILLVSANVFSTIENTDPVSSKSIDIGKGCGTIRMQLPSWVELNRTGIKIKRLFPDSGEKELDFNFYCKAIDSEYVTDSVIYNSSLSKWELNPKQWERYAEKSDQENARKFLKIQQLKTINGQGWIMTDIGIGSEDEDYIKGMSFCLLKYGSEKALCGDGNVQYIPLRKDLDKDKGDFEPMLTQFLNTIQFVEDIEPLITKQVDLIGCCGKITMELPKEVELGQYGFIIRNVAPESSPSDIWLQFNCVNELIQVS